MTARSTRAWRELIDRSRWTTHAHARTAVFEHIECFNNARRRHSAVNYLRPAEFERSMLRSPIAASP
ncbi:MAG: IS3 family transposase [Chloroflexi bacterium]|nr:IS3 family transposase [Chloroflexota bacterium]